MVKRQITKSYVIRIDDKYYLMNNRFEPNANFTEDITQARHFTYPKANKEILKMSKYLKTRHELHRNLELVIHRK